MPANPYDRMHIMPTVGDMIIGSQNQQKQMQRRQQRPDMMRRPAEDIIRTTVAYRPTPVKR